MSEHSNIFSQMANKSIMVVGDLMLDRYISGKVDRISPEAPVPVVDIHEEYSKLGGAGNVTKNIASLGATPILVSTVGHDAEGENIRYILKESNITSDYIMNTSKCTIVKTRVLAHTQQVVRLDKEDKTPMTSGGREFILNTIRQLIDCVDAVIISDYAKGLISKELVSEIVYIAKGKVPVHVDPKEHNFKHYNKVDLITPNTRELSLGTGMHIGNWDDMCKAANQAMNSLKCKNLLVTRGEHGMSLFEDDYVYDIPSVARSVFDVTGAGDTVIACYTLAKVSGASNYDAAKIANIGAGIVVGEVGAASVTLQQLTEACS